MKGRPAAIFQRAVAGAASLTGKRFGLLVASSLVATSAIVASALSNPAGNGPLAALLGRTLAAGPAAVAPYLRAPAGGSVSSPAGEGAAPSAPTATPVAPQAQAPSGGDAEPASQEPTPEPPSSPPLPEAGPIKHVFVISLTSPGFEAAFGAASQMPYLAETLRPQGTLLSNYTLLTDAGIANSIAAISGQPPNSETKAGCPAYTEFPSSAKADSKGILTGAGCVYPVNTLTLADQLTSARFTWHAYMEGMVDEAGQPDTCAHPGSGETEDTVPGGYSASQNPFVYFHSLLDLGDCAINDVSIESLSADLRKADKTANYAFIAPSPCDSGAPGQCEPGAPEGPANADAFLSDWVPRIQASPAFKQGGLIIVAFDAATAAAEPEAAAGAGDPLRVGALLISPLAVKGATDSAPYTPYSLLRANEEFFGLQQLAMAAAADTRSFAPKLLGETGGD